MMRADRSRSGLRLLGIAVLAVAGLAALGRDAAACQTAPEVKPSGGCCASRPERSCGCCERPNSGATRVIDRIEPAAAVAHRVDAEAPGCVCRVDNAPAAPGGRTTDRLPERRGAGGDPRSAGVSAAVVAAPPAAMIAARSDLPATGPPRAPIYLRTAHLRF